jgi:hypothetical protein
MIVRHGVPPPFAARGGRFRTAARFRSGPRWLDPNSDCGDRLVQFVAQVRSSDGRWQIVQKVFVTELRD